jgi:proline racemase
MAVLSAMGLLQPEHEFVHESLIGTTFKGTIVGETLVADVPAIVPEIEGEAYITGESTFVLDDRDPLCFGFRV